MPELPEVETIRRQLDKVLTGQRIIGKKIIGVKRKAKMIVIELSDQSLEPSYLLIHLKMTGQLIYNGQPGKYTRKVYKLTKGTLIFNDLRKFGWIKVVTNRQLKEYFAKLPSDVVDKEFTPKYLSQVLKSSGRAIKLVLLDQQKMGGIGNIYANEALFCAGIRPSAPANKVKDSTKLHHCIVQVIKAGIRAGGTTVSDESFVNLFGRPGRFQKQLRVYENKDKCLHCGTQIQKIKLGGRGTYFCPGCQK